MSMDIEKVRLILSDLALAAGPIPDDAVQKIAVALLHIAEGVEEIRARPEPQATLPILPNTSEASQIPEPGEVDRL